MKEETQIAPQTWRFGGGKVPFFSGKADAPLENERLKPLKINPIEKENHLEPNLHV